MQTLRQVLGREEERQNLKSVGLCYLLIVALMTLVFAIVHLNSVSPPAPANSPGGQATPAVRSEP